MASMPFPCNGPLGVVLVFLNVLLIFWLVVLSLISIYSQNGPSSKDQYDLKPILWVAKEEEEEKGN